MKSLGIIQGWIFEFDGVLYDGTAWRRWLLQLLTKRGLHTHYDIFFRLWELEFASRVRNGDWTFQQAIEKMLFAVGMSTAHINEITPALRSKRKSLEAEERLLPGVMHTLKFLAASGYQLAVSAAGDCVDDRLGAKLSRLGIASCFDFVGVSPDHGDRGFATHRYQTAINAMRLSSEEVVFVGHNSEHLAIAQSLGLQTVSVACPQAAVADWHLERLAELTELLTELPSSRRAG